MEKTQEKTSGSAPVVGCAYRCPDGVVRWITHRSTRGYFHLLWLDEERQAWHYGGRVKARDWRGGTPYPAPQPGDTYVKYSPFGRPEEWTVPTGEVQP